MDLSTSGFTDMNYSIRNPSELILASFGNSVYFAAKFLGNELPQMATPNCYIVKEKLKTILPQGAPDPFDGEWTESNQTPYLILTNDGILLDLKMEISPNYNPNDPELISRQYRQTIGLQYHERNSSLPVPPVEMGSFTFTAKLFPVTVGSTTTLYWKAIKSE